MRFPLIAAAIVVLSLIACKGPRESTPEIGPEDTPSETPELTEPSPSDASATRKSSENILVETPEYTGVIISENGGFGVQLSVRHGFSRILGAINQRYLKS